MTADPTAALAADLAQFAADTRQRAEHLAARIWANSPDGHLPNAYISYLTLTGDMLTDAARHIGRDGRYVTADLDTADPYSALVDQLLAEYATA